MDNINDNIIYSWTFSTEKNRGSFWYIIVLSLLISCVIVGYFFQQYIFSFVLIFMSGFYFYMENNSEKDVIISLTDTGIWINKKFYNYVSISYYSVIYEKDIPFIVRLNLAGKGSIPIDIEINQEIFEQVEPVFMNYINQGAKQELSFFDKIIRITKF